MSETIHDGGHGEHLHGGDGFGQSFGQDHDGGAHGGHHHHHVGELSSTPQGSVSWTSALRDVKLADALQLIRFTPNQLFLLLFLCMGLWLFVVYWVRHNEPLATQVLGTQMAKAPTANVDRRLVAEMRRAVPVRTGPSTGIVFVPSGRLEARPLPGTGLPSRSIYQASLMKSSRGQLNAPSSFEVQANNPTGGAQINTPNSYSAYHIPVQTSDGLRLKTVVNR